MESPYNVEDNAPTRNLKSPSKLSNDRDELNYVESLVKGVSLALLKISKPIGYSDTLTYVIGKK